MEPINFQDFMSVDNFVRKSVLNDTNKNAGSHGIMRLNRFVGVLDVKKLKSNKLFANMGHNNEIEDWGADFLAWNIFKINCPSFKIKCETKEVDAIPRHYFQTWEYDDLSVSFLESSDMKIRHYFFEWMESALSTTTFTRHYYDDIKAAYFVIYPLSRTGVAERYEIFENLVPTEISSIDYDVSDEGNNVVLTTVKFRYIGHRVLSFNEKPAPIDRVDTRFDNQPDRKIKQN